MNYETKTLPSGIVIENRPDIQSKQKYRWYIKNIYSLHNEGAPACETCHGAKLWYQYNKQHRLDGPAVEGLPYERSYHINGICYAEKDYWNHPEVLKFKYLKEHPELEAFV